MVMDPIPRTQQLNISSPGRGHSQVTHQVVMDVLKTEYTIRSPYTIWDKEIARTLTTKLGLIFDIL